MTFDQIVSKVATRLNLTSTTATTRIGLEVNERYAHLVSSIGLETAVRGTATANTVVGTRTLTFTCEKLFALYNANYTPVLMMTEITFTEMRAQPIGSDPPRQYAIQAMGASSVTVLLSTTPASIYTLTADVELNLTTLAGSNVPAFPADYHDILVFGVMADELYKLEKYEFAQAQEARYEARCSDLRMFIAKSAFLDLVQGGTQQLTTRNFPGMV